MGARESELCNCPAGMIGFSAAAAAAKCIRRRAAFFRARSASFMVYGLCAPRLFSPPCGVTFSFVGLTVVVMMNCRVFFFLCSVLCGEVFIRGRIVYRERCVVEFEGVVGRGELCLELE